MRRRVVPLTCGQPVGARGTVATDRPSRRANCFRVITAFQSVCKIVNEQAPVVQAPTGLDDGASDPGLRRSLGVTLDVRASSRVRYDRNPFLDGPRLWTGVPPLR